MTVLKQAAQTSTAKLTCLYTFTFTFLYIANTVD